MITVRNLQKIQSDDIQFLLAKYAKEIGYSKGSHGYFTEYITNKIYEDSEDDREFGWRKGEINFHERYFINNDENFDMSNNDYIQYEFPDYSELMAWILFKYKCNISIETKFINNASYVIVSLTINDVLIDTISSLLYDNNSFIKILEDVLFLAMVNIKNNLTN